MAPTPTSTRAVVARLLTVGVFAAAGLLMYTSAAESDGSDLRPGRYDDLADLARKQADRVQDLRTEVTALEKDVARLSDEVRSSEADRIQERSEALRASTGLDAVEGPGLTVVLDDAPKEVLASAGDQVNNALVHQQDIQAVANALWAGGAEAMTIRGQRVISTTGIKCVGNTVILHGVPYSPPYDLAAIGNPERLQRALDRSPYVRSYLQAVDEWQLGWEVEESTNLLAPAYDGPTELQNARVP